MKWPILTILGVILFLLCACCTDADKDCQKKEFADKQAQRTGTPELVSIQDNIVLYRVWTDEPYAVSHWTYFTTPCGDTSAQIDYSSGKFHRQIPSNVNGTGCK